MPDHLLGPTLEEVQMWLRSASAWVRAGLFPDVERVNARLGRVLVVEDDPGNLIKPFGLQELLARIRAVLRRSKQPGGGSGQMLQHGALAVDLRTHKVTVHGNQIAVTPKEFAILECLASDPGRVVSRQEMLERACDEHWYGPTKVLDVHMAALGTVLLARPTGPLDNEITGLWIILGTISVLALLAAALLAFALARWVSRPLAGLDRAAARLADGDLASRAVVDSGPPELRRLARTFNTMAGRLEALVHGNRAVIADVSHQLRTPLAALRLRRAFLRFTTSNPNGTGLGLAIVHRLATANGGAARLAETPGGGLTAILDFPAGPAPSAGRPESGSAAPPAQDFISR